MLKTLRKLLCLTIGHEWYYIESLPNYRFCKCGKQMKLKFAPDGTHRWINVEKGKDVNLWGKDI